MLFFNVLSTELKNELDTFEAEDFFYEDYAGFFLLVLLDQAQLQ